MAHPRSEQGRRLAARRSHPSAARAASSASAARAARRVGLQGKSRPAPTVRPRPLIGRCLGTIAVPVTPACRRWARPRPTPSDHAGEARARQGNGTGHHSGGRCAQTRASTNAIGKESMPNQRSVPVQEAGRRGGTISPRPGAACCHDRVSDGPQAHRHHTPPPQARAHNRHLTNEQPGQHQREHLTPTLHVAACHAAVLRCDEADVPGVGCSPSRPGWSHGWGTHLFVGVRGRSPKRLRRRRASPRAVATPALPSDDARITRGGSLWSFCSLSSLRAVSCRRASSEADPARSRRR